MCVIFFTGTATCGHRHFLGSYHCGHPGCSIDSQHIFPIEDDGYPCETCALLDNSYQLALDAMPVKVSPTTPYIETVLKKEPGMWFPTVATVPGIGADDSEDTEDLRSDGVLSNVDSVTSHWRRNKTKGMEMGNVEEDKYESEDNGKENKSPALAPASDFHKADAIQPPPGFRPKQIKFIPSPTPDPSPNTAKHRNLVLDQLANLPGPFPPHNMPTPAFQPILPAELSKYPLLPLSLPTYSTYPLGMSGDQLAFLQGSSGHAMQYRYDPEPSMSGFAFNPQAPEWQAKMNNWNIQREAWEAGQRDRGRL